jgi:hypothetical protein
VCLAVLTLLLATCGIYANDKPSIDPAAAGSTYYVSPNGSDGNPGTQSQPWATPGYGSRRLKSGDTLIIMSGRYVMSEYDRDELWPQRSGTADSWITIKGEGATKPVLAGRNDLFTALNLTGRSYIRIENLEFCSDDTVSGQQRYFQNGVVIEEPASNIILKDLYIHHLDDMGMNIVDVNHLQVINCRIEYCAISAMGGPRGEHGGWRNVLIKGCSLSYSGHYYRGGDGSNRPYDRPDGFEIPTSNGPLEVVDTIAQHNWGDGFDSQVADTYIHNCIVANNYCDGIKIWRGNSKVENTLIYGCGDGDNDSTWVPLVIETDGTPNQNFELVNVTIHDNPTRRAYSMTVQYDSPNSPTRLVMRNCIIADSYGAAFFAPGVNLTLDNNIFYRPNDDIQVEFGEREIMANQLNQFGPGNISADPLFVKPAWGSEGDYHLSPGSPAIDTGSSVGIPAYDLAYGSRPQGQGYDRGCYEYGATPAPGQFKQPDTPTVTTEQPTVQRPEPQQPATTTITTPTTTGADQVFNIPSRDSLGDIRVFRNNNGRYELLIDFLSPAAGGISGLFYEFDTFADASSAADMINQMRFSKISFATSGPGNIHTVEGRSYARITFFTR